MSDSGRIDAKALRQALLGQSGFALAAVEVFNDLESTNRYLLARPARPGALRVCVAEYQTRGRGRRGRRWHVPAGAGLCLSAGWVFAARPADVATIALATAVAARRAVAATSRVAVALKWPNDLVWNERKLGGILVELATLPHGRCHVVVGIGINVAVPPETLAALSDWPGGAVDLRTAASGAAPDRTALAATLCLGLGTLFADYERDGFAVYRDAWRAADHLADAPVVVARSDGELHGIARGIDASGALLVSDVDGRMHRVISGDVSVRRL